MTTKHRDAQFSRRSFMTRAAQLGGAGALARVIPGCAPGAASGSGSDPAAIETYRYLRSDGIADHETGAFPNPGCPIAISPQRHEYRVLMRPVAAASFTKIAFWELGVAVNGVPLDPAGPHWRGDESTGWQFEVMSDVARPHLGLDIQNAHVQPSGAYHYHGVAPGLVRREVDALREGRMCLLGWAADGFPIYAPHGHERADDPTSPLVALRSSYRLRSGARSGGPGGNHDGTFVEDYEHVEGLGDLDVANGRFGRTPEFPEGTYHYVLTDAFPFIPRFFRATPDPSFGLHARGPGLAGVPPALRDYRA